VRVRKLQRLAILCHLLSIPKENGEAQSLINWVTGNLGTGQAQPCLNLVVLAPSATHRLTLLKYKYTVA